MRLSETRRVDGETVEAERARDTAPGNPHLCWWCGQGFIIGAEFVGICPECHSCWTAYQERVKAEHNRRHDAEGSACRGVGMMGRCELYMAAQDAFPAPPQDDVARPTVDWQCVVCGYAIPRYADLGRPETCRRDGGEFRRVEGV